MTVTRATATRVVDKIDAGLSPYVVAKVGELIEQRLLLNVGGIVSKTTAARLNAELPTMLHRTLLTEMTQSLTRSLTHALVPTLTLALTHDRHQDIFCSCVAAAAVC